MAIPVLEGELLRLHREVDPVRADQREAAEIEPFQDVQLREDEEPLGDRSGLVHLEAPVVRGDRRMDEGLVELTREVAPVEERALPPEEGEEPLGELPPVEGLGAVGGHGAKAPRQIGRRPALSRGGRPPARQEQPCRVGEAAEDVGPLADPPAHPRGHGDAVLGELDRRSPELRPRKGAPALPDRLVEGDGARDADRVDALERHQPEALRRVVLPGRARRGDAASVEPEDLPPAGVVDDGEPVAAEAAHHGEQHALRRGDGDRRVEGIAATLEDRGPDHGRSRVGGGHHASNSERLGIPGERGSGTPGAVVRWARLAHGGHSTRPRMSRRGGRSRTRAPRR